MKERILNTKISFKTYNFAIRDVLEHPLFSGSAVMIFGTNISNFIAYVYHLIVGRMLGPASYGVLVATLSLIGLVTVSFQFLGLVIIKFVSAEGKHSQPLYIWFRNYAYKLGILFSLAFLLLTPFLSNFLNIDIPILLITAPAFLFSAPLLFYRSYLQGLLKFKDFVLSSNFELALRLIIGIVLILLGLSVFGAVAGLVIASGVAMFLLILMFRKYSFSGKTINPPNTVTIFKYTIPVFIATIANFSLVTMDLILVKHFFSAHDAGLYASISNLGKIIFYGTAPVSAVMFPIISRKHSRSESYIKIVFLSLLMTLLIAGGVAVLYYLMPDLMIEVLYGKAFLEASPYLSIYGLFMVIYTLGAVLVSFYLSREKIKIAYISLLAAIAQMIGIWLFHNSIIAVIHVNIIIALVLFISLLCYLYYEAKFAKD